MDSRIREQRREYICKRVTDACLEFDKHPKYKGRIGWGWDTKERDSLDEVMVDYIEQRAESEDVRRAFVSWIDSLCSERSEHEDSGIIQPATGEPARLFV